MCGIAGFWRPAGLEPGADALLARQCTALAHRGPDDAGSWLDPDAGIALGHRRLSILDLSALGHQPMHSGDGRWVIVFNGEIYNFAEIRAALEAAGDRFRGRSDTEVILAAVSRWGLEPAVQRMAGMFAFALWDRETRRLHLVRDRFGEKPLYYGWAGRTFLFGSELKALRAHPAFQARIDRDALTLYARYSYVPAPFTIYRGVLKLLPAHVATVEAGGAVQLASYWDLAAVVSQGRHNPLTGSDEDLVSTLEQRLRATVREEMVADVPHGALLSGGIDSTAVVALMQQESSRPALTFTIGFHEAGFNEAEHAKAVARHLGTEHTELYLTAKDALDVVPRLPAMYDEPFADSSQIPTFLVSQLARRHVTVALTGDGGDEMFGGYSRYGHARRVWNRYSRVPAPLRTLAGVTLQRAAAWTGRMDLTSQLLEQRSSQDMYELLVSTWSRPERLVIGGSEPSGTRLRGRPVPPDLSLDEQHMLLDSGTYLPDDILVKVDRASMAVSLETRAPLLDHRVAELAWRLPLRVKVRERETKWALRQLVYRYVPRALVDRPKTGFAVPVAEWVRGPLRDWARSLTERRRLQAEGFFDPDMVARVHRAVESGVPHREGRLWVILMFQAWLEAQRA